MPVNRQPVPDHDSGREVLVRGVGALGLLGIALIHFVGVFDEFKQVPYLGILWVALIVSCGVLAFGLVHTTHPHLWLLAGLIAGATFAGYVISRTTGLPDATDDIGNWTEAIGLAALFVEGLVVVLAAYAIATLPSRGRAYTKPMRHPGSAFEDRQSIVARTVGSEP